MFCESCKQNDALITCGDCMNVNYCSKGCQKRHWIVIHHHECRKTPTHHRKLDNRPQVIVFKAYRDRRYRYPDLESENGIVRDPSKYSLNISEDLEDIKQGSKVLYAVPYWTPRVLTAQIVPESLLKIAEIVGHNNILVVALIWKSPIANMDSQIEIGGQKFNTVSLRQSSTNKWKAKTNETTLNIIEEFLK